jgi:hypothetical protein
MFSLTRRQFPDLLWTHEDLDAVTDLWLAWHEQARRKSLRRLKGYYAIQLQLWGFPQQDRDGLRLLLQQNLRSLDQLVPSLDDSDSEYLAAKTPFLDFSHPVSLARWHALVDHPDFHGLVAILRLSLHDWPATPEGPAVMGGTLVICGHLRPDGFLLKALWPEGLERGLEGLYRKTVWSEEESLLRKLDEFCQTGKIPKPAESFFATRSQQRGRLRVARLVIRMPEDRRLPSFLFRLGFHVSILSFLAVIHWLLPPFPAKPALFLASGALSIYALSYILSSEIKCVWALHGRTNAGLRKAFSQTLQFSEANLAQEGVLDDPNVMKYSREVEALGGRHVADVRLIPGPSGTFYNRIYAFPAERIHLFLNLMTATETFQLFPAKPIYLLVTYLSDGRAVTIGEGGGFRKPLKKDVFIRRLPDIHDPAILLARHRKFLAELCAQGHSLAHFPDLSQLLERMSREHAETRELYEKHGYYPWSAAIRQSFGLVRREFLEPHSLVSR